MMVAVVVRMVMMVVVMVVGVELARRVVDLVGRDHSLLVLVLLLLLFLPAVRAPLHRRLNVVARTVAVRLIVVAVMDCLQLAVVVVVVKVVVAKQGRRTEQRVCAAAAASVGAH